MVEKAHKVIQMEFSEIFKSEVSEGKEKHVPVIEVVREHGGQVLNIVNVVVGKEVPHPNTVEHHIAWVQLYGLKESGQVVDLGKADFCPGCTAPNVGFRVNEIDDFTAFCAVSYCNVHGLWQSVLKL